ncbi:aminotransferase class V-fold PLP-dependent enzyme [Lampropedia puyangensis]|uniref:Aminotransferase class V-fold PLP-dependent enzyme n=1 Tax=Lampropedia puyangensis TaxID=1330072 RepID=A0A4S8F046_9BURK|nr:aminotransferase class V-fold PLP-dependent enzyme [Lampropedia puyangensis]THT98461.1 aminotransferase class V-fold PLP-dependent enzyme [Lampropedia puyangensis]
MSSPYPNGLPFSDALMREVRARFLGIEHDHQGRERLYFDNAGGSLRLKAAIERFAQVDAIPDNAERSHAAAVDLQTIQTKGSADLRTVLNARGGSVYASLTASGAMFDMVRAIADHVPGTNMVTTVLEHPSAFDAMALYAQRLGRGLRVAPSNRVTGGIDVDAIVSLIDQETSVLSVIYASNISGAKVDMEAVVKRAREIKPDLYIVVDAVQHAPHGLIDLEKTPVDGINLAPYKFFGCRGSGFSWLSERAAALPHHKLAGKPETYWDLGSSAPWQFAVLSEIVDYVCWVGSHFNDSTDRRTQFVAGITHIELQERALLATLLNGTESVEGLRNMPGVHVFLDSPDLSKRDLILAMGFEHLDCAQAVIEYGKRGVTVYERVASSIYSKRMLESFGLEGAVRVSPLHCHTQAEMEKFLLVTQQIAKAFAPA